MRTQRNEKNLCVLIGVFEYRCNFLILLCLIAFAALPALTRPSHDYGGTIMCHMEIIVDLSSERSIELQYDLLNW